MYIHKKKTCANHISYKNAHKTNYAVYRLSFSATHRHINNDNLISLINSANTITSGAFLIFFNRKKN